MNLQKRIERLEKDAQISIPAGARLYNTDGVQVDATVTRMPTKYGYGEAERASGQVVPVAPTRTLTLEDIIRRATEQCRGNGEKKETREESDASMELAEGILFLRVDGREGFCEIMNRAQRRLALKSKTARVSGYV